MNKHVWTPLNREMTDALFRENSVLLGSVDRIPEQKALELTCKEAVEFAMKMCKCSFNGYGNGNATICGLSLEGFRLAVTWMNIEALN